MVAGGVLRCHLIGKMNFDGKVGGVFRRFSLQGFYPLTNQRIPHLLLFYNIHFSRTKIKVFLKAPLAPIYTDFERGARAKKSIFFCQIITKSAQKRVFGHRCFYNLPALQKILAQNGLYSVLGMHGKSIWSTVNKKSTKFSKFF